MTHRKLGSVPQLNRRYAEMSVAPTASFNDAYRMSSLVQEGDRSNAMLASMDTGRIVGGERIQGSEQTVDLINA